MVTNKLMCCFLSLLLWHVDQKNEGKRKKSKYYTHLHVEDASNANSTSDPI